MKHTVKIFAFILATALLLAACNRAPVPPVIDETDAAETTGVPDVTAAAETTGAPDVTAAPDTTAIPETAAPETKAAETTAEETFATVTTAHEDAWTVVTPAGCRTAGSEERIVNGAIEQREIPLLGHDIAKDGYCTRCGERFSYGLRYERENTPGEKDEFFHFRIYPENVPEYLSVYVGNCTDTEIIIPDYYDGLPVLAIGQDGFYIGDRNVASEITSVTIPEGVIEIRMGAFDYCVNLTNVVFPSTMKRIQDYAFANCRKYTEIILPDSLIELGCGVFWMRDPVERTIVLSDGLREIGSNNFYRNMSAQPYSTKQGMYQSNQYPDRMPYETETVENGGHYIGSKKNPYFLLVYIDRDYPDFAANPNTVMIDRSISGELEFRAYSHYPRYYSK